MRAHRSIPLQDPPLPLGGVKRRVPGTAHHCPVCLFTPPDTTIGVGGGQCSRVHSLSPWWEGLLDLLEQVQVETGSGEEPGSSAAEGPSLLRSSSVEGDGVIRGKWTVRVGEVSDQDKEWAMWETWQSLSNLGTDFS